jgi:excisionase family DNA binding protein
MLEAKATGMPEYITTTEAGERLGISRDRVLKLIKAERLPATKVGRDWLIDPADLEKVAIREVGYPKGKPRTGTNLS